jgi:hypothetical protein
MNGFKEWWESLPKLARKYMCETSAEAGWLAARVKAEKIVAPLIEDLELIRKWDLPKVWKEKIDRRIKDTADGMSVLVQNTATNENVAGEPNDLMQ